MKKSLLPLALLPGVALAVSFVLTDLIMHIAVDREIPKPLVSALSLIEGQKSGEDPYAMFEEPARELAAAPHETVHLTAHDGTELVGHWFQHPHAERIILAAHGWRSVWNRDFCLVCRFWKANNCSVLYIEQRGQGQSGGDAIGFGMLEHEDLPDWLRWISARCGDKLPVYLAGISMGASTVLMAADRELPGKVRGIMADCGFTSTEAIWEHVARSNLHLPYLLMRYTARLLCQLRLGRLPNTCSTVKALSKSRYPVLLIHGEDDGFVPCSMTRENYAACRAPKKLLLVPGAIHGLSYVVMQKEYEAIEMQFWAENDGSP